MHKLTVFLVFTLWASLLSAQAIYRTVDEDGRVTYSDRPPADEQEREEAQLPPINSAAETRPRARGQQQNREQRDAVRYQVDILSPAPESSVPPGQRDLNIVVGLDRDLRPGDFLAIYRNDELLTETRERQFLVQEITRGSHQIEVEVISADGELLGASEPVTVHVHRPSVLNRPGS